MRASWLFNLPDETALIPADQNDEDFWFSKVHRAVDGRVPHAPVYGANYPAVNATTLAAPKTPTV